MSGSSLKNVYLFAILLWCGVSALVGRLFGYTVSAISFFMAAVLNAMSIVAATSWSFGHIRSLTSGAKWRAAAGIGFFVTLADILFFHFLRRRFYVWLPLGTILGLLVGSEILGRWDGLGLSRREAQFLYRLADLRAYLVFRCGTREFLKEVALAAIIPFVVLFAPRSKEALLFLPWIAAFAYLANEEFVAALRLRFYSLRKRLSILAAFAVGLGLLVGFLMRTYRPRLFLPSYVHGLLAVFAVVAVSEYRKRRLL